MVNEQKVKFTRKRFHKDENSSNRPIGNNRRLGPVSANRHFRHQLARKARNGRTMRGLHPGAKAMATFSEAVDEPASTGEKLWNVWNSVKLLFNSGTPSGGGSGKQSDGTHRDVASLNRVPSYYREDSSRSTIDTSLEYMPVQQENLPTTIGNSLSTNDTRDGHPADPRDALIARLQDQVVLLKKKVKYAREKNTLYKSLLDEANIGTSYLESRRHIKNLVRDNMKPESELPPSPERKVDPLVTSSPIRHHTTGQTGGIASPMGQAPPQLKQFYNKYPTLPHTESLSKQESPNDNDNDEEEEEQR